MKMTKRIFSLALCLVLMMALAVPAFAAGEYTLTVQNKAEGHIYEAYQIFSGALVTTEDGKDILSDIVWGSSITDSAGLLAELKTAFAGLNKPEIDTAAEVAEYISNNMTSDSESIDKFAEIVGGYLGTAAGTSTQGGKAGEFVQYTITGLDAGYYLVKDKDGSLNEANDVYTKYIIRVLKNETVTAKGSVPEVDKTINDTIDGTFEDKEDFDIGDTAYYKWVGTLPSNLEAYETYYYEFQDNLSTGLKFTRIEKIYIEGHDGNVVHTFIDLTDDVDTNDTHSGITVTSAPLSVNVKFNDLKTMYLDAAGDSLLLPTHKIVVKYSALVTRDAVTATAIPNAVKLIFSNNPQGEGKGETPEDEAYAFTFQINVDKYDADDSSNKLPGAEFILYYERIENDTKVNYYAMVVTEEMIYKTDENGVLTNVLRPEAERTINGEVLEANDIGVVYAWTTDRSAASILDTDADGKLAVRGLDSGLFLLEETKAPAGYNLMETPVRIEILPTYAADGSSVEVAYKVDYIDQTSNVVGVRNSAGSTLPITGGVGTTMFYIVGGLMVAAAVVLLITKRRAEEN